MNKKLLSVVLSATCVLALAACTGNNDDKILADSTHAAYCIAGPSQTTVGGASIAWDYSEAGSMVASSRNDLKEVSSEIATELEDVKLSSLYIIKDVAIGGANAGWSSVGYLADESLVMGDGSLCLKVVSCSYDAGDDVYAVDEWLPSAEHYGETLTPDVYWVPGHNSVADANGLDHNSNPLVVAGAGLYTVVLARYAAVNEAGSYFGIGLVQQTANEDGEQVTNITPVSVSSLGVIGSFGASAWTTDTALTLADGTWTGSIEAVAGDQFKVRANGSWDYSWGFADVTSAAEGIIADADGNISAVADGTYSFSIVAPTEVSIVSKTLTTFAVTFEAAVNPIAAVYTASAGDSVSFTGIYLATNGSDNYVGFGDYAVDVYGATLPEGIAVGDKVSVSGTISVYKGLVEVSSSTVTLAPDASVAAVTPVALDGSWAKVMLSRPATLSGTVVTGTAIDGTANVSVSIAVGSATVTVYVKKSVATLDYTALNTALGTTGNSVSLTGFVGIYDGATEVDYATSTGFQMVYPTVVVAA